MAEIHNLKELNVLNRKRSLQQKDIICFSTKEEVIEYEVTMRFLNNLKYNNSYIFNCLGLNEKEKINLAEKYYRYKPQDVNILIPNNWPEYKYKDFSALERLIREIYKMLRDNITEINKEEFITNRFEILDL